ncbi:hypothetical protein [Natrarchaeobius chitinivorans]|uniref:Envelope protein N-terminal domain-containing protein n=1 Tax=Natrarchaeobius chitinivorans TaxID=1679083 RepID=A0A3N6NDY7_NATCH|nr:hypothetical protein [Natrarchaeobius chitinivorans]RQG97062.1 hypothetical protein EA473_03005 [Natrarchaeobius chitinivorans]
MGDSDVYQPGQCLLARREMMLRAGTTAAAILATQSGSVTACDTLDECDYGGGFWEGSIAQQGWRWATDNWDGLFSSGYDKDEVDDMSKVNQHWRIYDTFDMLDRHVDDSLLTEVGNWVQPGDPDASALSRAIWSEVDTWMFRELQDGTSDQEILESARHEARERLDTRYRNTLRQWNEYAADVASVFLQFAEEDIEFETVDHVEGEAVTEPSEDISLGTTDNDLHNRYVISSEGCLPDREGSAIQWHTLMFDVVDYELPTGETEPYYRITAEWRQSGSYDDYFNDAYVTLSPFPDEFESRTDDMPSEYGDTIVTEGGSYYEDGKEEISDDEWIPIFRLDETWNPIVDAIQTVEDTVESEINDYVYQALDAVTAGDIEDVDLVSAFDMAGEIGDGEDFNILAAQSLTLGLAAPPDVETEVTIDINGMERTGHLFPDWDFTQLHDFQYEHEDGELVVFDHSLMPDSIYLVDDGDEVHEFTADELEGGVDVDEPVSIDVDPEGELSAGVPTGTTLTAGEHFHHAQFGFVSGDEYERRSFSDGDEITLLEVDGDDDTTYELSSYETVTRDPARSVDRAHEREERYVTVQDLEEQSLGGGGSGGVDDIWLIGGLAALILSTAAAALMGDS